MKAEELSPIATPGGNLDQRPYRTRQTNKPVSADNKATIDSTFIKTPSQQRIQFNKLEATNSKAQQIAQQIRHVNESMETIGAYLSEMRVGLEHIVKMYPPYPPGSTERIEALRQFSALRKMIDQVTRSAGGDGTTNNPAADGSADGGGDAKLTMSRQPLHTGRGGLDIPDISTSASDEQILGALDRTVTAQALVQVRRRSFIVDANRIISELS